MPAFGEALGAMPQATSECRLRALCDAAGGVVADTGSIAGHVRGAGYVAQDGVETDEIIGEGADGTGSLAEHRLHLHHGRLGLLKHGVKLRDDRLGLLHDLAGGSNDRPQVVGSLLEGVDAGTRATHSEGDLNREPNKGHDKDDERYGKNGWHTKPLSVTGQTLCIMP